MTKVVLGITTYGPIPRVELLIKSIEKTIDPDISYIIAVADDSAGGGYDMRARKVFYKQKNIALLAGETITGIPASWNRIVTFAKQQNAQIVVILSDGIRFLVPGWLQRMVHFLETNTQVGTVGTPTVGQPSFDSMLERWDHPVGRVGCAVGCSFAFRTEVAGKVKNVDGTTGFWEDLISFHEELDFGFSLSQQGYLSYMLPYPPSYYRGGLAFAAHDELIWRSPSQYLPLEEFLIYARLSPWHVPQYEENYAQGKVDKMSYSRVMFAKKWKLLEEIQGGNRFQVIAGRDTDILAEPQIPVHHQVVTPWPAREITWLDRNGQEKKSIV